ncbi:MAG: hypothetical protein ACXAC5_14520 [Promethearchaeota archaeon]
MNFLIISHLYSPILSPRAFRWSAIAEIWAQQGHIVDVICCWHPGLPRSETFKKVNVFRVGRSIPQIFRSHLASSKKQLRNRFSLIPGRSDKNSNDGLVRMSISLIKHLYDFTWKKIYWPDYACLWYFAGKKATKKLLREKNYDAVISVSLPFTSHLVGLWIKKHHVQVKWLVDSGDPFCFLEATPLNNNFLYRNLNYKIERSVFKKSDWITVTTNSTAKLYKKIFPEAINKIHVVPPLLNERIKGDETEYSVLDKNKINLSFIGNFYKSTREPDTLLSLFQFLLRENPILQNKIMIHFFGNIEAFNIKFEKYRKLKRAIALHGSVSKNTVDKIIKETNILINLGNTTYYQLPSKIVEYVSSGKPIINICKLENDSSMRFLENYPLHINILWNKNKQPAPINELAEFITTKYNKQVNVESLNYFLKPYKPESISRLYFSIIQSDLP